MSLHTNDRLVVSISLWDNPELEKLHQTRDMQGTDFITMSNALQVPFSNKVHTWNFLPCHL